MAYWYRDSLLSSKYWSTSTCTPSSDCGVFELLARNIYHTVYVVYDVRLVICGNGTKYRSKPPAKEQVVLSPFASPSPRFLPIRNYDFAT